MRTIFIKRVDLKTKIITTDSFLMNAANKERFEQELGLKSVYPKYFKLGKPWKIPVVACNQVIIHDGEMISYTEYCDNTVPRQVHLHERMHFFYALADEYSQHDEWLKTEMLVDFMACQQSNLWDESISFYKQYLRLNQNNQLIISFLEKAQEMLELFKKLD